MSDSFEWPEDVIIREVVKGRDRQRSKEDRQFIYCEDLATLKKVSALPGKAGWVWLLAWHRSKVTKSRWITLPQSLLDEWGIGRSSKSRALGLLQKAEMIEIECIHGRSVRVRLTNIDRQKLEEDGL
jgi:hypothetical protein